MLNKQGITLHRSTIECEASLYTVSSGEIMKVVEGEWIPYAYFTPPTLLL